MERKAVVICSVVVFLGLLSAATGFGAEGTRIKEAWNGVAFYLGAMLKQRLLKLDSRGRGRGTGRLTVGSKEIGFAMEREMTDLSFCLSPAGLFYFFIFLFPLCPNTYNYWAKSFGHRKKLWPNKMRVLKDWFQWAF